MGFEVPFKAFIFIALLAFGWGCQTAKKSHGDSAAKSATFSRDIGQTVRWHWSWNGRTATLREPFLFHIMYANAPYLGLRAYNSLAASNGCVAGSDCSADCGFEVFRPSSVAGNVLTDRIQVSCSLQNPRAPKGANQIYLSGLIDGLSVSYRPKIDGQRSVAMRGPFASELFFSFQKAAQNNRYMTRLATTSINGKMVAYQYLVPKNNWYFLFKLDQQVSMPAESNLSIFCSTPKTDNDDSTCVFRL